jgi:hypothetical protein
MRAKALVLIALAVAPAYVAAQSPIMRPKQTAQRAVDRTNAHTAAMTDTTAGRSTAMPSSQSATSSGKSTPHGERATSAPSGDTTKAKVNTSKGATANKPERTAFEREIFSYERSGRRDPFMSLMTSSEIRPLIADLRLVGVAYDPSGRSSVAVLREDAQDPNAGMNRGGTKSTADVPQYRVKEGQQIGRMRVARIGVRSVTFTIEEFGYSRQETLTLSDSNTEKKP